MLFNSYEFIFLFLPLVMLVFYGFCRYGKMRAAVWWTGFSSLLFYAVWDVRFLFLFMASIVFNFLIGNGIIGMACRPERSSARDPLLKNSEFLSRGSLAEERSGRQLNIQKTILIAGLVVNLGLLAFFKYSHFFLQNIIDFTGAALAIPDVILPIGISFFTFTQIAYLVDCLNKQKYYKFPDYLVFVSFFPHLVAGPILRHDATIPQIESKKFGQPTARKVYIAILFFSIGLFKKVMIADSIAVYVDKLFANVTSLSMLDAWAAAILYTFQIFFDFSAYSEMAIGLALLMNVRIPFNFNSPYKATSIIDFWRRWHISLSSFLRDYLYIPLGGNRKGPWRRYINLLITMLLGGLWHGAAWTFVIWGGLHGIYLSINHAFSKTHIKLPKFFAWSLTFFAVVIAWIFFRAQHLSTAVGMLKTMLGLNHTPIWQTQIFSHPLLVIVSLTFLITWTLSAPNTQQVAIGRLPSLRVGLVMMALLIAGILGLGQSDHFIYFQF